MGRKIYRPINYKKQIVNLGFTVRTLFPCIILVLTLFVAVLGKEYLTPVAASPASAPQAETTTEKPKGFDITFKSPGGGTLSFKVEYDRNGGVKQ